MTVLYFALGVLAMVLGIGVSIALHEIGHLVPAKKFGVRCSQYMVGFGPTLWSTRRGDTEYGIKAIPLGGYVRMLGMFPPAVDTEIAARGGRRLRSGRLATMVEDARAQSLAEIRPGEEHRAFYRLSTPKKIVVMLGGPLMNLVLASVILTGVVLTHGAPARGAVVGTVAECVRPVSAAGDRSACTAADRPTPAAAAGVRPGDRIVAIDGKGVGGPDDVGRRVRPLAGETVPMTVVRDGQRLDLTITPIANAVPRLDLRGRPVEDGSGGYAMTTAGFIGTTTGTSREFDHSPAIVPGMIADQVSATARVVLTLPYRLVDVWQAAFGTEERDAEGPMSVVGVGRVAGEISSGTVTTSDGQTLSIDTGGRFVTLWGLLAGLNVALFVFNLIPLLPLDGGHIAGALWEALKRFVARVTRRPDPGYVDVAKALPVAYVVSIFFIGMSMLLIYADIVKPIRF